MTKTYSFKRIMSFRSAGRSAELSQVGDCVISSAQLAILPPSNCACKQGNLSSSTGGPNSAGYNLPLQFRNDGILNNNYHMFKYYLKELPLSCKIPRKINRLSFSFLGQIYRRTSISTGSRKSRRKSSANRGQSQVKQL